VRLEGQQINQAVFERFLVFGDGDAEAEPTGVFGILLQPDLLTEQTRAKTAPEPDRQLVPAPSPKLRLARRHTSPALRQQDLEAACRHEKAPQAGLLGGLSPAAPGFFLGLGFE
jgi:hypothetical protein